MAVDVWEMVGWAAAFLTMFGFLPQVIKIHRTKSVEDVSLPMLIQFTCGLFLWLLYGIHLQNDVLIVSNVVSASIFLLGIGLYFRYYDRS